MNIDRYKRERNLAEAEEVIELGDVDAATATVRAREESVLGGDIDALSLNSKHNIKYLVLDILYV